MSQDETWLAQPLTIETPIRKCVTINGKWTAFIQRFFVTSGHVTIHAHTDSSVICVLRRPPDKSIHLHSALFFIQRLTR